MALLLNQPDVFGNYFLQPTPDNTLSYGGSGSASTLSSLRVPPDVYQGTSKSGKRQNPSTSPQGLQLYSTENIYGLSSSQYVQSPKRIRDNLLPNLSDSSKQSSKFISKKNKPATLPWWYPGAGADLRRDTGHLAGIQRRSGESKPAARVKKHKRKRRINTDLVPVEETTFLSREDEKIQNIRSNDAIFKFRQQDFGWIPSAVATLFQIFSFFSNKFGGSQSANSESSSTNSNNVDRIDSISSAASGADNLDVAVGTLMAYGGKYLRQMGLWAFEHASQIPAETLTSASPLTSQSSAPSIIGGASPAKPYISTIPLEELEKLGQSAVEKGADPTKLQQAFADAQINGNWSKLESEIAAALGPDSVKVPNPLQVNLANILSLAENSLGSPSTPVGPPSSSTSSTGPASASDASLVDKINYVINGNPNRDPFTQVSFLTRLVTEFELQDEFLGLQENLNGFIGNVNTVLGEETPTIDKIDEQVDQEPGSSSQVAPSFMAYVSNALSLLLPNSQKGPENKVDTLGPDGGAVTQSQVQPLIDPTTATLSLLGSAALGTIAFAYLSKGGGILPGAKRRADVSNPQNDNRIDMDYAFGGFLDDDDLDYPNYYSYIGQGGEYAEETEGASDTHHDNNSENPQQWEYQATEHQQWEHQPPESEQWSHQTAKYQHQLAEGQQWTQPASKWQQQFAKSASQQQQQNNYG